MSEEKIYYDVNDNPMGLYKLIKTDPGWAQSRIQVCEKLESKLSTIKTEIEKMVEKYDGMAITEYEVALLTTIQVDLKSILKLLEE